MFLSCCLSTTLIQLRSSFLRPYFQHKNVLPTTSTSMFHSSNASVSTSSPLPFLSSSLPYSSASSSSSVMYVTTMMEAVPDVRSANEVPWMHDKMAGRKPYFAAKNGEIKFSHCMKSGSMLGPGRLDFQYAVHTNFLDIWWCKSLLQSLAEIKRVVVGVIGVEKGCYAVSHITEVG